MRHAVQERDEAPTHPPERADRLLVGLSLATALFGGVGMVILGFLMDRWMAM